MTKENRRRSAEPSPHRALVLLSGGIDSATCVAFYLKQRLAVEGLFLDYGQPAARYEHAAARWMSKHFGIELGEVKVRGFSVPPSGFVSGRNALLVATALSAAAPRSGLIVLGIHAGVSYPDCKVGFLTACQGVADIYNAGAVRLAAPFVDWTKEEIIAAAKSLKVPLEKTYSCEAGKRNGCGVCLSCLDRAKVLP